MKPTKTINAKLNGLYDVCFTLQFEKDEQGNEYGILTCPFVKWITSEENTIWNRVYRLTGNELECIEKHYFDNNVITILIKDHPFSVDMEDVLHKVVPPKIYRQMINGTYKIATKADKLRHKKMIEEMAANDGGFDFLNDF